MNDPNPDTNWWDFDEHDPPEHVVSFAATVMVIALAISLSACVIAITHAIWPYLMAAFEATQFAP